jgi:ABC-type polysaccharide/polyol phosphate transport system ATPase subunit
LEVFKDSPFRILSTGMKARLAYTTQLEFFKEIILFDEGLVVGDEDFVRRVGQRILGCVKTGRTLVLVSHDLARLSRIAHRILWLEEGKVRAIGPTKPMIEQYQKSFP